MDSGFFVKISDTKYLGPYETLNRARQEARRNIEPNLKIYHGILKRNSENIIDDSELFLVPRNKNNE